jgi:hypothetical protein
MMENKNDFNQALTMLEKALSVERDNVKTEEIKYYIIKCNIFLNNQDEVKRYYSQIKNKSSVWGKKIEEMYSYYNSEQKNSANSRINIDKLNLIIKAGGSLQEYLALYKYGISEELYIELLNNKIDPEKFREDFIRYNLDSVTAIKLVQKGISIEDFQYLTKGASKAILTEEKFWYYSINPVDLKNLADLYRLGFNEEKFLTLKRSKINISLFVSSLKKGFTEKDFFNFKDKEISDKELDFYQFFLNKKNSKNDFYIARMFGKEGYDQFLLYLNQRMLMIVNLSLTCTVAAVSIGLFSAGFYQLYQASNCNSRILNLWKQYYESTDYDEKFSILNEKIPAAEQAKKDNETSQGFLFGFAAGSLLLCIIPAVFTGYFAFKNYKMLNVFSSLNIEFNSKYVSLFLRFNI